MIYVALLRGINVGGNNIIKMEDLRSAFEKMGFSNVQTYIQSGNVIFESKETNEAGLEQKIEKELKKVFGYSGKVMIRSQKDTKRIASKLPNTADDPKWKTNVLFLDRSVDAKKLASQFETKEGIDTVSYTKGVVYWAALKDKLTRSKMLKLPSDPIYQKMTIRNARTTRKILEKMASQ